MATLSLFPRALWHENGINTLLVVAQESHLPTLNEADGAHIQFMQVIPLHPPELRFKQAHGVEGLLEHWERRGQVPFYDPYRSPEPAE